MPLSTRENLQLAVRSLFLQVLLNYRSMQGPGYLFALWPYLRKTGASAHRVRAAGDFLNAHPILAALAIGALRRRIEDGDVERDPADFSRWQISLCGPLGITGDALIWDRWKPLVFALAVLVILWAAHPATWFPLALVCLLLYNAPLQFLRVWGIGTGYRFGAHVLAVLTNPAFKRVRNLLTVAGALTTGTLLGTVLWHTSTDPLGHVAQFLIAFGVTFWAARRQWNIALVLPAALTAALAFGMVR